MHNNEFTNSYLNEMSQSMEVGMNFQIQFGRRIIRQGRGMPAETISRSQTERIQQVNRACSEISDSPYKVCRHIRIRFLPRRILLCSCLFHLISRRCCFDQRSFSLSRSLQRMISLQVSLEITTCVLKFDCYLVRWRSLNSGLFRSSSERARRILSMASRTSSLGIRNSRLSTASSIFGLVAPCR